MLLVGLTGGLASGATTVAELFRECGAFVMHADQLARTVVEPGKAAWRDVVNTFGRGILRDDRTVNRHALAALVFHHPRKLSALNRIMHPRIAREQARQTAALARQHPNAVILYDAALLIESNAHTRMDTIIVMTTPRAVQLARARRRDGLTRVEALGRLRGQLPLAAKRRVADYQLNGTTPVSRLRTQVRRLYHTFLREAESRRRTPRTSSPPRASHTT